MKKLTKFLSYVLVAALSSVVTLGVAEGGGKDFAKLEELSALIDQRFINEADPEAMEDAAADAMVYALGDRWSYYISADDYSDYLDRMNNSYVGIGITIVQREDGYVDIREVVPDGPADQAGVRPGDILTHAAGQDVAQIGMTETTNLIKGEEGTDVTITIQREGQSMDVTVTRAYFETVVATGQMTVDGIGLVTIENFDSRCVDETKAAIDDLLAQGATALIFDVRNNPGGYKNELVELLDLLLPEGPLFRSEYYDGKVYVDESDPECLDIPMAVLVNSESYSAAEFFAAALREYDAAIVVGQQTIGKGYFQQCFPLSDGSAVNLSVGRYTTPNGVCLADVGLTPDVEVEVDDALFLEIYYGNVAWQDDPQILAAIDALKNAE